MGSRYAAKTEVPVDKSRTEIERVLRQHGASAASGARIDLLLAELHRLGAKVDVILPDGTHLYWCTGHRHGITGHCGSETRLDGGPKLPAKCKWCDARCRTMASSRNDAHLWALMAGELALPCVEDRHRLARTLVAIVRRERAATGARTFGPGEAIPLDVVEVYDLDGDRWERQSADPESTLKDSWKMPGFDPDEHEARCQGVWITPYLLDEFGPLTEIGQKGTRARRGGAA